MLFGYDAARAHAAAIHQQLPHSCQLSAPSRSCFARTALALASTTRNKYEVSPAIAHCFLSAQLTLAPVAQLQLFIFVRAQTPLSAVLQLRASRVSVASQRRASASCIAHLSCTSVGHQLCASASRVSVARQRRAFQRRVSASRFRVAFQRRASRISRQGHASHIAHPLSASSFSLARPASRIARQHCASALRVSIAYRASRVSVAHRASASHIANQPLASHASLEHHASRVSLAHSASAKLATPQRIGATCNAPQNRALRVGAAGTVHQCN